MCAPSPLTGSSTEVPNGVRKLWTYRHSVAPAGDCSAGAFLGPYKGLPPKCYASSACTDYDYSLNPDEAFNGWYGSSIGHCTLVYAVVPAVLHNLTTGEAYDHVPDTHPVGPR